MKKIADTETPQGIIGCMSYAEQFFGKSTDRWQNAAGFRQNWPS